MLLVHLDLERGWRGGQRQVQLLIRDIERQAGGEVRQCLVCRAGSPFVERLAEVGSVEVVEVRNRIEALLRLPRGAGVNIYHAHSGNTVPIALYGARAAGAAGRIVITRRVELPVTGALFRRADALVAISSRVAQVLEQAGVPSHRVRVIPSAIDSRRRLEPDRVETARAEAGLAGRGEARGFIGLTVAALVGEKDPLTLVEALSHLPGDYRHVWVGNGALGTRVGERAAELGVEERLVLPGFDPDPDRWFGLADVFVLPSLREGLGSVLLDAFHFGVPVVATDIPGPADLLEDGVSALLFAPGDADGLARCIGRLRSDAALAARLVDEGRRRVAAYDIRRVAGAYLDLYRQLAGG